MNAQIEGLHVLKFGGTSLGGGDAVRRVVSIVASRSPQPTLVVCSAIGPTTDDLLDIAETARIGQGERALGKARRLRRHHRQLIAELLRRKRSAQQLRRSCDAAFENLFEIVGGVAILADLSPAVLARILSFGELLSSRILHVALESAGLPAAWIDAREVVRTEDRALEAEPRVEETELLARDRLRPLLERPGRVVTQGFLGRTSEGRDSTLGRGGSDLSATLLGAALGADEVEIWTDVCGIMTADPSLVAEAEPIPVMSFREASELAFFGARVLHPRSLVPAIERSIPVRVRNTHEPASPGTVILGEAGDAATPVKSVAYKEGMAVLHLRSPRMFQSHGFLERMFAVLDRHRLPPHAVATSEVTLAIAAQDGPALAEVAAELRDLGDLSVHRDQAFVCLVGEGLRETRGIVAAVFADLADLETTLVSMGGSEIQLGFVVHEEHLAEVVRRLHRRFFEIRSAA